VTQESLGLAVCFWVFLFGLVTGFIAHRKGYSFWLWWLNGALLFILALPFIILRKPNIAELDRRKIASGSFKRCPYCAELIRESALVCRYCGRTIVSLTTEGTEGEKARLG